MKNIIYILTLIIGLSFTTFSQINYLEDSTFWNEHGEMVWGGNLIIVDYYTSNFVAGDTVINGFQYKKHGKNQIIDNTYFFNWPYSYLRQDGKKIYIFDNIVDTLLYDYDLQLGQTLPLSLVVPNNNFYVSKVDSFLLNGSYRKIFKISDTISFGVSGLNLYYIIEGAGNKYGLMTPIDASVLNYSCYFSCYGKGNQVYIDSSYGLNCMLKSSMNEHSSSAPFNIAFYNNEVVNILSLPIEHFANGIITILDTKGTEIFNAKINSNQTQFAIHKKLKGGVYFAKLEVDGRIFSKKIILIE